MTLDELRNKRQQILETAKQHGAHHIRVFGSTVRGDATSNSDVDFIVTFEEGRSIFDQIGLWQDLTDLLGCEVDLLTDHPNAGDITNQVRQLAVDL